MLFALNVEGALIFAHQEVKSQGSGKNSYESMFEQLWVVVKLVLAEKDYLLSVTSWTYLWTDELFGIWKYKSKLYIAYSEVARESMLKVADEIRQQTNGCSNHSNLEMEAECLMKTL